MARAGPGQARPRGVRCSVRTVAFPRDRYVRLPPLAGLLVARGLLDDDAQPDIGVNLAVSVGMRPEVGRKHESAF